MDDAESTRKLNKLLRAELSALDTYAQVLDRVKDDPFRTEIEIIEQEHRNAIEALRNYIRARGGEPASDGGSWEILAHLLVGGAARLFGNDRAIRTLRKGEERGCQLYTDSLEDDSFDTECKMLIRQLLLPKQMRHVQILDRILLGHGKAA